MEAIKTVGLTKKYKDVVAVDNLNLAIEKGELFSLLGTNGAGKTTTIKMLCTLLKPSSGDAFLDGHSILQEPMWVKEIIAISPQETAIAPNLTVHENLAMMCGLHGFDRKKTAEKVQEMADIFSLSEILNKKAGKLSGGWQRKLSIALALISQPKILFLDEPTLGLDILARNDLWQVIKSLKGKITIVLTTHYLPEAQALSDRIAIMKRGKIVAMGDCEQLIKQAQANDLETAFINLVKGEEL